MKSIFVLFALAWSLPSLRSQTLNLGRLFECLAEVEGGKADELGGRAFCSYQVWADRAPDLAYQLSKNEAAAMPVFRAHLLWIVTTLKKHRVKADSEAVATIWRFGWGHATRLGYKSDYGQRVAALMNDSTFKP